MCVLWDREAIGRSFLELVRQLAQYLNNTYARFLFFSPDYSALQPIPERVQFLQ